MQPDPREISLEHRVDEIIAAYLVRIDQGEQIDRGDFIRHHPEVADELRAYFANSEAVRNASERDGGSRAGSAADSEPGGRPDAPATSLPSHGSAETTGQRIERSEPEPASAPGSEIPVSTADVWGFLTDSGLMSQEELSGLQSQWSEPGHEADAISLAEQLQRTGKLTRLQWESLRQGRRDELILGNYVILERLGHGGMGQVYKAWHRKMDRMVALKTLRRETMKSRGAVERFRREVKAAARLVHPNIVTAYDADEHNGTHFLVMEYVEGENLDRWVRKHNAAPPGKAVDWILQAARALDYAHRHGVIHRDVKPGNLLLGLEATVKVLDMGLARLVADEDGLTRTGDVLGTISYMAPEQVADSKHADQRADIYSLGCTLHYLLLGRSPYGGNTLGEKLLAHRNQPIPSLRSDRGDVPQWLDDLFQRTLAKQAADRPETMAEVVAELERGRTTDYASVGKTSTFREGERPGGDDANPKRLSGHAKAEPGRLKQEAAQPFNRVRFEGRRRIAAYAGIGVALVCLLLAALGGLRPSSESPTLAGNEPGAKVEALDSAAVVTAPAVGSEVPLLSSPEPANTNEPPSIKTDASPIRQDPLLIGFELSGAAIDSVAQVAPFINMAIIGDWHTTLGRQKIHALADADVIIVLQVFEDQLERSEADLHRVLDENPSRIHAVMWHTRNYSIEQIIKFGQSLKARYPEIAYWADGGGNNNQALCAEPTAQAIDALVWVSWPRTAETARNDIRAIAGRQAGRPIVAVWSSYDESPSGLVPRTEPGTFEALLKAAQESRLHGVVINRYATMGEWQGVSTRPELIEEIKRAALPLLQRDEE